VTTFFAGRRMPPHEPKFSGIAGVVQASCKRAYPPGSSILGLSV
jgi:hypothetical protein